MQLVHRAESDDYSRSEGSPRRPRRPTGIDALLKGDVNRNALPQVTDCWVNNGKWLAAYQLFKACIYMYLLTVCWETYWAKLKPCNMVTVKSSSMCIVDTSTVHCELSSTSSNPLCKSCDSAQYSLCMVGGQPEDTCQAMGSDSRCNDTSACLPEYTWNYSKSILYIGAIALVQMLLELFAGFSINSLSSLYHEDFEQMTRFAKFHVVITKLVPYLTSAIHGMSIFLIGYAWLIFRDLKTFCPVVQDASGSMIVPDYQKMCASLAIGWVVLVIIGYHVRKNYKVSGDMYFPVTEPNPVICCFDLECTSRVSQREPRCLSSLYTCSLQAFPDRGCEICGMNKIPKMILRLGELVFSGYLLMGQIALKYLREIHHFGP